MEGTLLTTDVYFGSSYPNSVFEEDKLEVDGQDALGKKWALVKFDIPANLTNPISASLEVQITNRGSTCKLHEMIVDWNAASTFSSVGMTGTGTGNVGVWDPGVVASMVARFTGPAVLDVTSSVQKWQSGGSPNYGWIWEPTGRNGVDFYSSSGSTPPKLTITYTEAPTEVVEVAAEYTADELLPATVTASDLMSSVAYKNAKKAGLAAALAVPVSDITITGFTLGVDDDDDEDDRRLPTAVHEFSGTVSVKTTFTVQVDDSSTAAAVSTAISGASTATAIKDETDTAMATADWSSESVITAAPTIADPIVTAPVMVSALSPTPSPTPSPTFAINPIAATGDPHLRNLYGERFDLMQPGNHVLVNIPRGERADGALLRVQALASRWGGACADTYFREINVTGSWAEAKQAGGYHYAISQRTTKTQNWAAFGKVELKVVHGHTDSGLLYLNVYVKHLGRAGFPVGGLLGEDDHTEAATPPPVCASATSLLGAQASNRAPPSASSVAKAVFE